ncbi:MAG: hypothetical protein ACTSPY_10355 [Candidatus Helarchaeota archaeon]
MTMIEDVECETCGKVSIKEHMCRAHTKGKYYVNKDDADKINFYCGFCGRVHIDKNYLCEPRELLPEVKERYKDAKFNCLTCGQPVKTPGHICDYKENFTCPYCGKEIDISKPGDQHHMCPELIKKAKYFCRACGRLAVEPWEVCTPIKFEK